MQLEIQNHIKNSILSTDCYIPKGVKYLLIYFWCLHLFLILTRNGILSLQNEIEVDKHQVQYKCIYKNKAIQKPYEASSIYALSYEIDIKQPFLRSYTHSTKCRESKNYKHIESALASEPSDHKIFLVWDLGINSIVSIRLHRLNSHMQFITQICKQPSIKSVLPVRTVPIWQNNRARFTTDGRNRRSFEFCIIKKFT